MRRLWHRRLKLQKRSQSRGMDRGCPHGKRTGSSTDRDGMDIADLLRTDEVLLCIRPTGKPFTLHPTAPVEGAHCDMDPARMLSAAFHWPLEQRTLDS